MRDYRVPSPKEIKVKFQKSADREDFWSHYVLRAISRQITWFLLHLTLFAEFIAMMTPVVDLITIGLIASGNYIWAAIFTQLHIIVDCVDGEIARFRATVRKRTKQQGQFGAYVDSMAGMLVYPLVIFSAGFFLGGLFTGLLAMSAFYLTVMSSAYVNVYFPSKKSKSAKIRQKLTGRFKTKVGFSSAVQKSLITLALLFQTTFFLWIFIVLALFMVVMRYWVYRK